MNKNSLWIYKTIGNGSDFWRTKLGIKFLSFLKYAIFIICISFFIIIGYYFIVGLEKGYYQPPYGKECSSEDCTPGLW